MKLRDFTTTPWERGNSSSVCVCVQKINISSPLIIQTIRMYTYNIHVDCRFTDIFYERGHLISYFSSISVLICPSLQFCKVRFIFGRNLHNAAVINSCRMARTMEASAVVQSMLEMFNPQLDEFSSRKKKILFEKKKL